MFLMADASVGAHLGGSDVFIDDVQSAEVWLFHTEVGAISSHLVSFLL